MSEIDAVTLEVIRNGLAAIAEEMTATLVRTAYSPNITERRDCSCALFDRDGELLSQAETIPVHLGAMPFSVAAAMDAHPPETLSPGDAILLNDPFAGGAHLPDLTVVTPVWAPDGDVLALCANRAHHADVGGATGASVAPDTTDIYGEGLRIPPVKIASEGTLRSEIVDLILANVRTPEERQGDLRAQLAANATGRRRIGDLCGRTGADTLRDASEEIKAYSERRMRGAIADLPNGTYSFTDVLDDDGRGNTDLTIQVTVTVEDETVTVDFAGTDPQTEGPVNAVFAVTASATYYALRCMTDPDIPPNAGCYRPISIDTPSRSLVDARPPAAVVGGNLEVSQRIVDVILGAIGTAHPERAIAACQGTMNNLTFSGEDPDRGTQYAFYETEAGGHGGRPTSDGMDAVQVHMTNTMNTPVEMLETTYPLRVEQYTLRSDSGGAGQYRGGLGLRRDVRILEHPATVSLLGDRRRHAPYGLAGGDPGEPGQDVLIIDGNAEPLPGKVTRRVDPGATISVRTPGGGGYGDPADRDPEAIARDLRRNKITPAQAKEAYDYELNEDAPSPDRSSS